MIFYGTALLASCLLAGMFLGSLLGRVAGIEADIGGVGLGMLLLIGCTSWLARRGLWTDAWDRGVRYWGEIYIPIIVAMAASQDVRGSLSGGWIAIAAGVAAVAMCAWVCRMLIRAAVRSGLGNPSSTTPDPTP